MNPDLPWHSDEDSESPLTMMLPIVDVFLVLVVVLFAQARANPEKLLASVAQRSSTNQRDTELSPHVIVEPGINRVRVDGRELSIDAFLSEAGKRKDTTYVLHPEPGVTLPEFISLLGRLSAAQVRYVITLTKPNKHHDSP
jgi:biopolymer transport protein ExbD